MMKFIEHKRSREVEAWLRKEMVEQKRRYGKIVKEQEALAPKRDKWVADFLQRIQTRGVSYALRPDAQDPAGRDPDQAEAQVPRRILTEA